MAVNKLSRASAPLVLGAIAFVVIPAFLDYAQGAKTVALWAMVAALALARAVRAPRVATPTLLWVLAAAIVALDFAHAILSPGDARAAMQIATDEALALAVATLVAGACPLRGLAACGLGVAALGVLQVVFSAKMLTPPSDPGQFPAVTFGNRGLAGTFVAIGIVPAAALAREAVTRRAAGIWYAAATLMSCFVFLSLTRATWLGVAGGAAFFVARERKARKRRGEAGVTIARRADGEDATTDEPLEGAAVYGWQGQRTRRLAVAVLVIAAFATVITLIASSADLSLLVRQRLTPAGWGANPRFALWPAVLTRFTHGDPAIWIFGFGPGSFLRVAADAQQALGQAGPKLFLDAHFDALQALIETGALGLGLRIALIAIALRRAGRSHSRMQHAAAAAVATLLVTGLFFYPLRVPYLLALFAVLLATAYGRGAATPAFTSARGAFAILAIAAVGMVVHRTRLELAMHHLVREPGGMLFKAAERVELRESLGPFAPVPPVFLQILDPQR